MSNTIPNQESNEKLIGKNCVDPIRQIFDALLLEKKWKQTDLSKATGIDEADICRIVNANLNPPLLWKIKIAKSLGVDTATIWGERHYRSNLGTKRKKENGT